MLRFTIAILICTIAATGCHRGRYRQQADADATGLIHEKSCDARWQLENFHIYPHPESRFADPYCPDHPPKPCDDPAADCLSPDPQPSECCVGPYGSLDYLNYIPIVAADNADLYEVDPLAPATEPIRVIGSNNAYDIG